MMTYEIDAGRITDFSSFVIEIKRGFLSHLESCPEWSGNLDALKDLLSWPEQKFCLRIVHFESLKQVLSRDHTRGDSAWNILLQIFADSRDHVQVEFT